MGVNESDQYAASGDMKSVIWTWDLSTLQAMRMAVLLQYSEVELNAVMALEFDPRATNVFYTLQRSGHLTMCDLRTPVLRQAHVYGHRGRGSSLRVCHDSERVATSARGSEIKLWDWRRIGGTHAVDQYVQIYKQHQSEKSALGFDFLMNEQFLVTGSDSYYAHIYNTLSGELVESIQIAPEPVTSVAALSRSHISFYVIYRNGQRVGLVDTEGDSIRHQFANCGEIKALYDREAWEKAVFSNIDRVIEAARAVQTDIPVSYEHMMPIVRSSDLPICKSLMQELGQIYDASIKASTPSLVRDMQAFYKLQNERVVKPEEEGKEGKSLRMREKAGWNGRVKVEKTTVSR